MSDAVGGADESRLQRRYLDTVKAALANEHYLEHELRIEHLLRALDKGAAIDADVMRDPARFSRDQLRSRLAARRAGQLDPDDFVEAHYPFTTVGRLGLDDLHEVLDDLRERRVTGDLLEVGTGRGGAGIFLRAYLDALDDHATRLHVIDRFRPCTEQAGDFEADLNTVRDAFHRFGLLDDQVVFHQGPVPESLERLPVRPFALVRVGRTATPDDVDALAATGGLLAPGGVVVIEDASSPAVRAAVERLHRATRGVEPMTRIGWRGVRWGAQAASAAAPPQVVDRARKTLSVVVVVFNMRRAAMRTLHSLTPSYQEGIDGLDYEVVVVENGSDPDERLGADVVRSFGPQFRYVDMGPEASPSPVNALNKGIAVGRGDAFALMIDGAHLLSPGVIRYGLRGLDEHPPSITAIRHWYLGPGQQDVTTGIGYDEAYEDELLANIDWPRDGYALFGVGQFIGDRDWIDQSFESNCLFVPRSLLERYGCFDSAFAMPGGGYANLDLFERLESATDVTTVSVVGEATFHQVHGGITTNASDAEQAVHQIGDYERHYRELRGRPFHVDGRRVTLIGSLRPLANRSRGRRVTPWRFFRRRADNIDGLPTTPSIVPEDLQREFTDAFWRSLSWQETRWLGRVMGRAPNDLFSYQELINEARPDVIIVACDPSDGLPYFLHSVCDLSGHGRVVAIRYPAAKGDGGAGSDTFTTIVGRPEHPDVRAAIAAEVDGTNRVMVVVGARLGQQGVVKALDALTPFVTVGSYVVVENTAVNGHPIWRNYGPGPGEAVEQIVAEDDRFVRERRFERYAMTFNPGGCLRRVR